MEFSGQFDVIVIGSGVMGSSTAYHSSKRGQKTLLLEQFDFLHHRGSSHGESRTFRATYPEPYYFPMVVKSAKLWEEAESEIGYKVFFKTQQLDLGPSDDKSLLALISNCEKHSMNHQILDRQQADTHFSGRIQLPENWVAVVTELGGVLKPTKAVSMFQTLAIKHGAVLRDNTEVVDVSVDEERGGVLVTGNYGDKFWGKKCVVTAGAWFGRLVQKATKGVTLLPIQPIETSYYYWRIRKGDESAFTIDAGFPTFASYGEPYIYGTPALEFPDLIKVAVHGGRECEPDKRTWGAPAEGLNGSKMVIEYLRDWIKGRFGDLVDWEGGPVMDHSCLYSMTPDEDYVIDFLEGKFRENVVVAGGFSGHGFKMAPVVGKILAEMAIAGREGAEEWKEELEHFKLKRFEGNRRGNVKDFGDQVRLR